MEHHINPAETNDSSSASTGNSMGQDSIQGHCLISTPIITTGRVPNGGHLLLGALWRSPDKVHQIGGLSRKTKKFLNTPVKNAVDALARVKSLSGAGIDPYFAPAEYLTPANRTAGNVAGAYAFWVDIDVGEEKAKVGKGYAMVVDAQAALKRFCSDTLLPCVTHIVESGAGLHAYWALDEFVSREVWSLYAIKLKAIAKKLGFLADPARTADIASVLRVPGTLNFKYNPPRPVVLTYAADGYIKCPLMLGAIDVAYEKVCREPVIPSAVEAKATEAEAVFSGVEDVSLNLESLASALAVLDPDCDEPTWTLHRLAPMARAARAHPAYSNGLRELARSWSSGELQGAPSKAWRKPGGNGLTGQQYFATVWKRFLSDNYKGKAVNLCTIYFDAKEAGWPGWSASFLVINECAVGVK